MGFGYHIKSQIILCSRLLSYIARVTRTVGKYVSLDRALLHNCIIMLAGKTMRSLIEKHIVDLLFYTFFVADTFIWRGTIYNNKRGIWMLGKYNKGIVFVCIWYSKHVDDENSGSLWTQWLFLSQKASFYEFYE